MRCVVAMSGGVDSSAAALLALRAGWEVLGVTLRMRGEAPEGAAAVCARLGIPFEVWDVQEAFGREVIAPFIAAYRAGRTPNPCVLCNRGLKFGLLLREAEARGFDRVVSGHYARLDLRDGRPELRRGLDGSKDQSYVLCGLRPAQLARLWLPLGGMTKDETRALAREAGFARAVSAPESQDICFVPDGDYCGFIEREDGPLTPGRFVLEDGRDLGPHRGFERYTVGQRRGLGVAWEHPLYVLRKDAAAHAVVLGAEPGLFRDGLTAEQVNWLTPVPPAAPLRAQARTRYHQQETPCTVTPLPGGAARVAFDRPVRAPAPGQTVAFYDGDLVLGGGTIQ